MGQTLAIWKWRAAWPFRSNTRVMDSLGEDRAPFALTRFDVEGFADEIRQTFGDGDDAPFGIDVCDFMGHRANWITLSSGWSTPDERLKKLVLLCRDRGLHIFAAG